MVTLYFGSNSSMRATWTCMGIILASEIHEWCEAEKQFFVSFARRSHKTAQEQVVAPSVERLGNFRGLNHVCK